MVDRILYIIINKEIIGDNPKLEDIYGIIPDIINLGMFIQYHRYDIGSVFDYWVNKSDGKIKILSIENKEKMREYFKRAWSMDIHTGSNKSVGVVGPVTEKQAYDIGLNELDHIKTQ